MKCSEMVMSPVSMGLECELALAVVVAVEFEPEVAPSDGGEWVRGALEDCPEGTGPATGCTVKPEEAGVSPMAADIEPRGV
jgi:hypothetical protein